MLTVTMQTTYLEMTYRNGKPIAAYLYLARRPGDRSVRQERRVAGMIVDFAADGRPIGIEFTSVTNLSLSAINSVLSSVNEAPATADDVAPLKVA
jgi:hypothetical protein